MNQTKGRASVAFKEGISGTILKYNCREKTQLPSSHHREVSKKCSKLSPSPGFEPRPFVVNVPRYVRYRIDKVCLLEATVRYKALPRRGG